MNKEGYKVKWESKAFHFCLKMRAKLSKINNPVCCYTKPLYVYPHEVLIELCPKSVHTIEKQRVEAIYDASSMDSGVKHFCTLHLCVPMETM